MKVGDFLCVVTTIYMNMAKLFRRIGENSFEAGGYGSTGTINYSTGYGTPAGGNVMQNPDKFKSSNSSTQNSGHESDSEDTGSIFKMPDKPDRKSSSGAPIHPASFQDKGNFEDSEPKGSEDKPNTVSFGDGGKSLPDDNNSDTGYPGTGDTDGDEPKSSPPTNDNQSEVPGKDDETKPGGIYQNAVPNKSVKAPDKEFNKDVDQLFTKKITPTPDEILSALQYELNQMVKKDKHIAKATVLKNLKQDPKYYSRLDMLNIDDDKMKVDESTISKTKAVLDQMISERQQRRPVENSPEITDIFKELWDKRHHGAKKI